MVDGSEIGAGSLANVRMCMLAAETGELCFHLLTRLCWMSQALVAWLLLLHMRASPRSAKGAAFDELDINPKFITTYSSFVCGQVFLVFLRLETSSTAGVLRS